MPAQPTWIHNVAEILAELRVLPASHLDRRAIEKLFGLGERRARQLMSGLPCLQVGNAAAVERTALIAHLENLAASPACGRETARRERVEEVLADLRRQAAGRKVELPKPKDDLSAGIQIVPGQLTVRFNGAKDLAGKLFELSQAMVSDWEAFEKRCSQIDH